MSTGPIPGGLATGSINQASALADGQQSTKDVIVASLLRRYEGLQQYLTDTIDRNTALQKELSALMQEKGELTKAGAMQTDPRKMLEVQGKVMALTRQIQEESVSLEVSIRSMNDLLHTIDDVQSGWTQL